MCKLLICYKIFLLVDYLEWYQQFRGQVNIQFSLLSYHMTYRLHVPDRARVDYFVEEPCQHNRCWNNNIHQPDDVCVSVIQPDDSLRSDAEEKDLVVSVPNSLYGICYWVSGRLYLDHSKYGPWFWLISDFYSMYLFPQTQTSYIGFLFITSARRKEDININTLFRLLRKTYLKLTMTKLYTLYCF